MMRVIMFFLNVFSGACYNLTLHLKCIKLHGPSMFAVKAKIYGVLYNQASSVAFDETSSNWSTLKNT